MQKVWCEVNIVLYPVRGPKLAFYHFDNPCLAVNCNQSEKIDKKIEKIKIYIYINKKKIHQIMFKKQLLLEQKFGILLHIHVWDGSRGQMLLKQM